VFDFITFTWDGEFAWRILPQLLRAAVITVQATVVGFALALVIGLVFALLRRGPRLVSWPATFVVEFLRSTPLLIQLYALFFVLPAYGIRFDAFTTGVIGLGPALRRLPLRGLPRRHRQRRPRSVGGRHGAQLLGRSTSGARSCCRRRSRRWCRPSATTSSSCSRRRRCSRPSPWSS
jgi:His/Glu/Gln/Arg/opine family amino acid ABC transporter permease subunit